MRTLKKLTALVRENQSYHAFLKYNSPVKFLNYLFLECQRLLRCGHVSAYPYKMVIDTNNVCTLKCLYCPTGKGIRGRKKGFMTFDHFKRIIDTLGRYIYIIDLFNWGEPLLHKDIYKMIYYAEQKNICTSIHSNFNIDFNEDTAGELIRSGLSYLSLSLDGADREVYSIYRENGDFEKALSNAKLLIDMKKKQHRRKPFLIWQFLVFPHNKHQVAQAGQLAKELGFDSYRVLGGIVTDGLSHVTTNEAVAKLQDIETSKCDWLWTTAIFHWDGGVAPCCLQYRKEEDFGTMPDKAFKPIWNNEKYRYARSLFAGKRKQNKYAEKIICNRCFKVVH